MNKLALGVDIGGTHATAAVVDLHTGTILPDTVVRGSIEATGSCAEVTAAWADIMRQALGRYSGKLTRIGIAMPGPFDYANGIALMRNQGKYDALYGVNVRALVAEQLQLAETDIRLLNDAACFLQGEVVAGAAKGCSRAIGLTLGTGLGTARYRGGMAEDADLWKIPFHTGIAEEYLCSRWFVKRYEELTGRQVPHVKAIVDRAPQESAVVEALFREFGQNLALFLVAFVQEVQPEVIVLGGNISKAYPLFETALKQDLARQVGLLPVRVAELGEAAALIGAANLWQDGI
ncbi:hypothetical protein OB13_01945 [Pontibacter sp. HJ8]